MNFKELFEGAEPKLPGAIKGIQVMTPQQFVAKSAGDEEQVDNKADVTEISDTTKASYKAKAQAQVKELEPWTKKGEYRDLAKQLVNRREKGLKRMDQGVAEEHNDTFDPKTHAYKTTMKHAKNPTVQQRMAAHDIKPGIAGYRDRIDMLHDLERTGKLKEATKLAAPTRPIDDPELTDYLDRIRTQQKKKTDKYKLPYIHRSSVVGYYDEAGKKYNVDAIKAALKERPKALLKKNEKMKHSDGTDEQFFNVGFAALVGIALDENTNELIVVNTCPGAGSCKIDCFAMKGGKVQFQGPWLSDGRILTYLLNDPDGFFNRLKEEISKEEAKGKKGGYKVSIRWHDAGDFFSPEYAQMAFKLAEELPNVDFYAYTKVAGVALGEKPDNFMINWSEGASVSQEKQVKGSDPNLEKTKNSRIVPSSLFYDLLVKDEKKNLVKGPEGQWQVIPDKLPELKHRLAKEYGLSANSILSYDEWDEKVVSKIWPKWLEQNNIDIDDLKSTLPPNEFDNKMKELKNQFQFDLPKRKITTPLQYNVIIAPGEPDLTAKDAGVLSTLLLKH